MQTSIKIVKPEWLHKCQIKETQSKENTWDKKGHWIMITGSINTYKDSKCVHIKQ